MDVNTVFEFRNIGHHSRQIPARLLLLLGAESHRLYSYLLFLEPQASPFPHICIAHFLTT